METGKVVDFSPLFRLLREYRRLALDLAGVIESRIPSGELDLPTRNRLAILQALEEDRYESSEPWGVEK